jgi:hypothetical protein
MDSLSLLPVGCPPKPLEIHLSQIKKVCPDFWKNSPRRGGCIPASAYLLEHYDFNGRVYWVDDLDDIIVCHAYVILDKQKPSEFALNVSDNGYDGFPHLTVAKVLEIGRNQTIPYISRYIFGNEKHLRKKFSPLEYHATYPYRP